MLVAPSAMTSCRAFTEAPEADATVHRPLSASKEASTTSNSSLSVAPARLAAATMRASKLIRLTAAHAACPSFSLLAPM